MGSLCPSSALAYPVPVTHTTPEAASTRFSPEQTRILLVLLMPLDKEVKDDMKHWPFKVVPTSDGRPAVEVMNGDKRQTFVSRICDLYAQCLLTWYT